MVVADIGATTGYVSRRMAPAVMPGGKVLAVDVQPEMISLLQAGAAKRSGLPQIEARLGAVDDVRLPAASVDLAVMVDVYHELAYPYEVLATVSAGCWRGTTSPTRGKLAGHGNRSGRHPR